MVHKQFLILHHWGHKVFLLEFQEEELQEFHYKILLQHHRHNQVKIQEGSRAEREFHKSLDHNHNLSQKVGSPLRSSLSCYCNSDSCFLFSSFLSLLCHAHPPKLLL